MATCRSCRAPVRWVLTQAGKRMPLDPAPTPVGNIALTEETVDGVPVVRYLGKSAGADLFATDRYVSHFATCPEAKVHRR